MNPQRKYHHDIFILHPIIRSNIVAKVLFVCHDMPNFAAIQANKGIKAFVLPWQIKSTLVFIFILLNRLILPCFAWVCPVCKMGLNLQIFWGNCKTRQIVAKCSSQIVVNDSGVDYSPFNGRIVKGVSNLGLSL